MAAMDAQFKESIAGIDAQLRASVASTQKGMLMIMETMQEMSDKLQTKLSEPPKEELPALDPRLAALVAKMGKLEQSVQETKRHGKGEIDMSKLCLFPNAKLPEKFKGVDFEKFDGTGDPRAHLQGYVGSLP